MGPRSPSAPGSPCVGKKTDAISPCCPSVPSSSSVPAHNVAPARLPQLPFFQTSHTPSLPWVRWGRVRLGGPSGCPPPRPPVGRAQSGPEPRGPQEGPLRGKALPKPLCQGTGCGHPSPEGQAGTLTMDPSSSHHLPWALGALGVQASHPFPGKGREIG